MKSIHRNLQSKTKYALLSILFFAATEQMINITLADEEGGGWISSHDFSPPSFATEGRNLAIDILGNLNANRSFYLIESLTVRTWIQNNLQVFRSDLVQSPHRWSKSNTHQSTCAETLPYPNSAIHFAWDKCHMNNRDEAARLYLELSARHLGIQDNGFSQSISNEILRTWDKIKQTMVPTCYGSRHSYSKSLLGKWKFDSKETERMGGETNGLKKAEIEITSDLSITKVVPSIGNCVTQAGTITIKSRGQTNAESKYFLLSEFGNEQTVNTFAKGTSKSLSIDEVTIRFGADSSNDILYLKDTLNPENSSVYKRITDHSKTDSSNQIRPGCRPSIFHRCRTIP